MLPSCDSDGPPKWRISRHCGWWWWWCRNTVEAIPSENLELLNVAVGVAPIALLHVKSYEKPISMEN